MLTVSDYLTKLLNHHNNKNYYYYYHQYHRNFINFLQGSVLNFFLTERFEERHGLQLTLWAGIEFIVFKANLSNQFFVIRRLLYSYVFTRSLLSIIFEIYPEC